MATLQKRGENTLVTISNGYDTMGKQIRVSKTYVPDKSLTPKQQEKALEKFVFEFEQQVKNGNCLSGDKITFKDFAEKWLVEYGKQQLAVTTLSNYITILNKYVLPEIGHLKLSKIKPLQLQSLYNKWSDTGIAPATVKKRHAVISVILKTAVQWQIINDNPCKNVSLPKATRDISDIKYFTLEQADIFLNALNTEYVSTYKAHTRVDDTGKPYKVNEYQEKHTISTQLRLFFILALFTGMRRGELIALTWSDIDFDNNIININKSATRIDKQITDNNINIDKFAVATSGRVMSKSTKNKTSDRCVSISSDIIKLIKDYRAEQRQLQLLLGNKWEGNNYIFIQWNGKQMSPDTPSHAFKNLLIKHNSSESVQKNKALELPLIPLHGLRHTNATFLIASKKIDIKTIQNHMGHADSRTTLNIYAHALKEREQNCADVIDTMINIK